MQILVTRPEEDARGFGEALSALGHVPVLAPLMDILYLEDPVGTLPEHQAVVLTSANGARAAARVSLGSDKPCFAVGPATAAAAKTAGFSHIIECGGDVRRVADAVKGQLSGPAGTIVHMAGSVVAGDLKGLLEADGFEVARLVLYEAHAVDELPKLAQDFLAVAAPGAKCGIALFSPRTAGLFVSLVDHAGLSDALKYCQAYCLSAAVADKIEGSGFGDVLVAGEPRQDALLNLIGAE